MMVHARNGDVSASIDERREVAILCMTPSDAAKLLSIVGILVDADDDLGEFYRALSEALGFSRDGATHDELKQLAERFGFGVVQIDGGVLVRER